jgi:hypothetical protein
MPPAARPPPAFALFKVGSIPVRTNCRKATIDCVALANTDGFTRSTKTLQDEQ